MVAAPELTRVKMSFDHSFPSLYFVSIPCISLSTFSCFNLQCRFIIGDAIVCPAICTQLTAGTSRHEITFESPRHGPTISHSHSDADSQFHY